MTSSYAYPDTIFRTEPSDPHSALDYAAIGAHLECNANSAELAAFSRFFHQSTDGAMAALATFAAFKCTAVCERLAGRIAVAQLAEANADTVYRLQIQPSNRW